MQLFEEAVAPRGEHKEEGASKNVIKKRRIEVREGESKR